MKIFYLHILSPLYGLLINIITQLLGYRYIKKLGLLHSVYIGFLCGFLLMFAIEIASLFIIKLLLMELFGQIILNSISYIALGYCYFHFINLGETARRVRIARELRESEEGLSMDELLERYNASKIIHIRLQRMIENKQIIDREGRYFIGKPVMLYIAKIIVMLKLIFLGKRTEFE